MSVADDVHAQSTGTDYFNLIVNLTLTPSLILTLFLILILTLAPTDAFQP